MGPAILSYPKDKAILLLPDVFGLELVNTQVRFYFSSYRKDNTEGQH